MLNFDQFNENEKEILYLSSHVTKSEWFNSLKKVQKEEVKKWIGKDVGSLLDVKSGDHVLMVGDNKFLTMIIPKKFLLK